MEIPPNAGTLQDEVSATATGLSCKLWSEYRPDPESSESAHPVRSTCICNNLCPTLELGSRQSRIVLAPAFPRFEGTSYYYQTQPWRLFQGWINIICYTAREFLKEIKYCFICNSSFLCMIVYLDLHSKGGSWDPHPCSPDMTSSCLRCYLLC